MSNQQNFTIMKKLSLFSLTLLLGLLSATVMGQNKCTVGNTTIYSSENIKVFQTRDNVISSITNPRNNTADFIGRDTYTLSIEPTFFCTTIGVINNEGFEYVEDDPSCSLEIPEGHYSIVIHGYSDEGACSVLLTYELEIHEDISLTPDESEAVTIVQIDSYDENGNVLGVTTSGVKNPTFIYSYSWHGDWSITDSWINLANGEIGYKYNTLPDETFIRPTAIFLNIDQQKTYFVDYDIITEESQGHSENRVEEMLWMKYYFNLNEPEPGDTARFQINYRKDRESGWALHLHGYDPKAYFNPSEPLTVVTNVKDDHPGEFGPKEEKYRIIPMVYESVSNYHEFYDDLTFSAMYINADNMFVREPFDDILNNMWNALYHESEPNHYPMTPAMMVEAPGETHYYGFRTPIWYFQGLGYGSDGPMGFPFYGGIFCAFGEGGVQRATDDDNTVLVKLDGETIYDDHIYAFNEEWNFVSPDDGVITMDIEDNHVENEGLVMANRTHIEFDLRNEEAYPPTLTILQVMENNIEKIDIQNLSNSKINIAAGDFTIDIEEMHMVYVDKPEIEVWYAIDGGEYQPLEVYEDESMFHVNYGNFFVVDLGQLEGIANDKWVSLKVTVTDAQGNFQTQELDNLFYAGEFTSVQQHETPNMQHQVYPNPFKNEVCIKTSEPIDGEATMEIYNMVGEKVYSQRFQCHQDHEFHWNGAQESAGLYFYKITTLQGLVTGSVLKE